MASRSQRAVRFREGYDGAGVTAYQRGERSLRTNIYQRTEALKVGGKPPPANTVAPAVTGTATVGQTLTTTNGTWTGVATPTYARQWFRGNHPIAGATALTYVLQAADQGYHVFCRVTATDANGSAVAPSNLRGPIA
jgi:hypothetical protein